MRTFPTNALLVVAALQLSACTASLQYVPIANSNVVPRERARVYIVRASGVSAPRPGNPRPAGQTGGWSGDGFAIEVFDEDQQIGTLRVSGHLVYDRRPGYARFRTRNSEELGIELEAGRVYYLRAGFAGTAERIAVLGAEEAVWLLSKSTPASPVADDLVGDVTQPSRELPVVLTDSSGGVSVGIGDLVHGRVEGRPVAVLVAAAGSGALTLIERPGAARVLQVEPSHFEPSATSDAAAIAARAEVTLTTSGERPRLFARVVAVGPKALTVLPHEVGAVPVEIPWAQILSLARLHRVPPAAGHGPLPGDEVVLGRAEGGVYRGTVVGSTDEQVSIRLADVEQPVAFAWSRITNWACGDATVPIPGPWQPPSLARARPRQVFVSVDALYGQKLLPEDDWGELREQRELGGMLTIGEGRWGVQVALDHLRSETNETLSGIRFRGATQETAIGGRLIRGRGPIRVIAGAGVAHLTIRLRAESGGESDSVSGTGYGPWLGAGVQARMGRHVNVGLAVRQTFGTAEIGGTSFSAGGTHVGLSVGFGAGAAASHVSLR